jgi:hypothetical protein
MTQLSDWIDLDNPESLNTFTCLLGNPKEHTGLYDHIKTQQDLLPRLKDATIRVVHEATNHQPSIIKIYDIDSGTPLSIGRTELGLLLETKKLDPLTPVHFRASYGGLFLFLLTSEIPEEVVKTTHTYLALDKGKKEPWGVRLGAFTLPNQVWAQQRYNGKTTTLAKALSVPYLSSFSLAKEEELMVLDVPW